MMVMLKRMKTRWKGRKKKKRRRKRWTIGMQVATREDSIKMNMGYRNLPHPNKNSKT
jgi:hypothetical protein